MKSQYQAYLLRLHRSRGQAHWRVTMENAHTGELLHFATEREMLRYLMQILTSAPPDLDGGQVETNNRNPSDEQIDAA